MNTRKYLILLLIGVWTSLGAFAQVKVTGMVSDSKNEPIIGATIVLKQSKSIGTTTDINGKYTLVLPEGKGAELVVSFIGYQSVTAAVKPGTINFTLVEENEELDEVVVVGYGTMRKSDLTGSVSSVAIEEGEAARAMTFDQLLKGKAAGVQLVSTNNAPGSEVNIVIRGNSTFNGGGEPLYVVDGVILNPPSQNEGTVLSSSSGQDMAGSDQRNNALSGINPQDIQSMEILKDASATAIYGAMGANGVVLITTKTGSQKGKTQVDFSTGIDISTRTKKIDVLDLDGYTDYLWYKQELKGDQSTYLNKIYINYAYPDSGIHVRDMDWQDYVMRTSVSQRYRASVSGKVKGTSYTLALGYKENQGIIKKTGANVTDLRLNFDKNLGKYIKLGTRTSLSRSVFEMTQSSGKQGTSNTSLTRSMIISRPFWDNDWTEDYDEDDSETESTRRGSPDRWLTDYEDNTEEFRVTPSVYLEAGIMKWLTFKSTLGIDYRNRERVKWKGASITSNTAGAAGAATMRAFRYNLDNMLMFNKKIKDDYVSGTLGTTFTRTLTQNENVEAYNFDETYLGSSVINSGGVQDFSYSEAESAVFSYLARLVYSIDKRYVLTATFRADASSHFSEDNRWGYFPSFAFAWRVQEEKWLKLPKAVSNLKIRAGWGQVGNQAVSAYQTLSTYSSVKYGDASSSSSGYIIGVYPSNLANKDLKWETTEQVNLGIDLGFFDNRFNLSADVYDKTTYDLLQEMDIPATSGYTSMWVNQGTINNRGLEISVDAMLINHKNFSWDLSGNISFNRNKIVDIGFDADGSTYWNGRPYFYGSNIMSGNELTNPGNVFIEGEPMGLFVGIATNGLVQENTTFTGADGSTVQGGPGWDADTPRTAGAINYVDQNGDGYISTEDRVIIGDCNPDFVYGFNTSFRYKNWTLSAAFNGSYGNDILNTNPKVWSNTVDSSYDILSDAFYDTWSSENTNAKYPAIGQLAAADRYLVTDLDIEDASFLRLANLSLFYEVPVKKLGFCDRLSFGVSVSNVYVWTNYSAWDPEVNSHGSDMTLMGIDNGSYPSARTFSFSVDVSF